ncbi:MAG: amino acid adenylation domain-containing protein [Acidobacteriota bacterium]
MTFPERAGPSRPNGSTGPVRTDTAIAYWIEKLRPFRQSPRFLPNALASEDDGAVAVHVAYPEPAACAVSTEVVGLAAFVLVASRYNGGEPLVVALPGQERPALVFFAASAMDEQQEAGALLDSVRTEIEQARRHQPCALDRVAAGLGVSAAQQERDLLQLVYAVGPTAPQAPGLERGGVTVRVEGLGPALRVEVRATGAACAPPLLPQLTAHIARAIEWLASAGRAPLRDFELLSAEERRQIAHRFNDTRVAVPEGLTLHGLVAAQAARTPDRTAIVHRDVELSYLALDAQANRLAAVLAAEFAVSHGDCVGVMMDRSEKTIVALYGVMKAGAAYVPIDPHHPWETVRYMIENAGIAVLIVDSESIAAAARFAGSLLVIDIELRGSSDATDSAWPAAGTDLAYVIYTSGSTGRPKGVAVQHRAVVNTILWRNAFYGIGASDVNLQLPSFAFDSSVVDIFCVLTVGGMLIVPDDDLRLDARRLIELSAARRVTSCIVTPSYYKLLVAELAGALPSLRWVTLAGEIATSDLVAAHLEWLPGVALYNEYGPTENAVCSTACRLDTMARTEPTVPIGRPIANVAVVILDAAGRLSPIGVPGEIYLGGAGLARGYLNQEALTAERFVPSPVPDVWDGRLYKTGDRACWRVDGTLEFLGRFDRQVKIRGFRIELDHVELALCRRRGVDNAAVICKADAGGAHYLAAYVEGGGGLTPAHLREHIGQQLPAYMMPDVLTVMPRLPLNLNGKVDRAALALIDDGNTPGDTAGVALSPFQATLVGLWAEVLKHGHVALDDNFFAMGGNSLRVMELTARIRGELSLGVELLDIYSYPTVRELADRLCRDRVGHAPGN